MKPIILLMLKDKAPLNLSGIDQFENQGPGIEVRMLKIQLDALIKWEQKSGYNLLTMKEYAYGFIGRERDTDNIFYSFGEPSTDSFRYGITIPRDPLNEVGCYKDTLVEVETSKYRGIVRGKEEKPKRITISYEEFAEEYGLQIDQQRQLANSRRTPLNKASELFNGLRD